jgi:vesicle coat complex subunit
VFNLSTISHLPQKKKEAKKKIIIAMMNGKRLLTLQV